MINGTEGFQFSPNIQAGDTLYTFNEDLMRSSQLVSRVGDPMVDYHAIDLIRFVLPPSDLVSASSSSSNNKNSSNNNSNNNINNTATNNSTNANANNNNTPPNFQHSQTHLARTDRQSAWTSVDT
jgi:hypothetical protein